MNPRILEKNCPPDCIVVATEFNFPTRLCTSLSVVVDLLLHLFNSCLISANLSKLNSKVNVSVFNNIPKKTMIAAGGDALYF